MRYSTCNTNNIGCYKNPTYKWKFEVYFITPLYVVSDMVLYGVFHDSVFIFTEAFVSLQLDSSSNIRSPLPSSSDQDIREEINSTVYPECGKR